MNKEQKTNVMRILDAHNILYVCHYYTSDDGKIDGVSVAEKLNQNPNQVFKTLLTKGVGKAFYVFIVPVNKELQLKSAAKSVGEKAVSMIPVQDITKVTGYIRGGCSPIGMKKSYETVLDESCLLFKTIMVSGGKIGVQVEVNPNDLIKLVKGKITTII